MWRRLRERWRRFRANITLAVAWDLFMVYLALVNLGLILFDLTYLWLRPTYFHLLPVVVRIYDPVKGIEPEPLTLKLLEQVDELAAAREGGAPDAQVVEQLAAVRSASIELWDDNPFERSGLEQDFIRALLEMRLTLERQGFRGTDEFEAEDLFDAYWSLEATPAQLDERLAIFQAEQVPLLEVNYLRHYSLAGRLTDHFWKIDLPFLLIFLSEFLIRWYLAVKRRTHPRWFFFPIFHWYDLLGVLPFKQTRFFRLFRVVSIYVRLHRSRHSVVGDDPISRTVKYFSNIISEEISDMVSLRILNETQEELREGTHKHIIRTVAEAHRDKLAEQLSIQARELMVTDSVREHARGFLDANLERAVESADALRRVPLPAFAKQSLVESIGRAVFDAFFDTLAATLSSDEGHETVKALIADSIDGLVVEATEGELEEIVREISIEVIGHMKETVAVRKWALPDQPRRSVFTRDVVD
jgi:hypothetical protein